MIVAQFTLEIFYVSANGALAVVSCIGRVCTSKIPSIIRLTEISMDKMRERKKWTIEATRNVRLI